MITLTSSLGRLDFLCPDSMHVAVSEVKKPRPFALGKNVQYAKS